MMTSREKALQIQKSHFYCIQIRLEVAESCFNGASVWVSNTAASKTGQLS
jgi:hypothetical protein